MIEHSHQPGFVKEPGNPRFDKPVKLPCYVMEESETRRWMQLGERPAMTERIEAEVRQALAQPTWEDLPGLWVYTHDGSLIWFVTREPYKEEDDGNLD